MIAATSIESRFSILWHSIPSIPTPPNDGDSLLPRRTHLAAIPPEQVRVSHFDLMIQLGEKLRTWELLHLPVQGEKSRARRLPDHQLKYLEYEGPVSQNRGHVIGWERGTAVWNRCLEPEYEILLFGTRLTAKLLMRLDDPQPTPGQTAQISDQSDWLITAEIWQLQQ